MKKSRTALCLALLCLAVIATSGTATAATVNATDLDYGISGRRNNAWFGDFSGQPVWTAGTGDRVGLGEIKFLSIVPEPSTFFLATLGLLGLLGWRRRFRI